MNQTEFHVKMALPRFGECMHINNFQNAYVEHCRRYNGLPEPNPTIAWQLAVEKGWIPEPVNCQLRCWTRNEEIAAAPRYEEKFPKVESGKNYIVIAGCKCGGDLYWTRGVAVECLNIKYDDKMNITDDSPCDYRLMSG